MKVKTTNQFYCLDEINIFNLLAKVLTASAADTDILMGDDSKGHQPILKNLPKFPMASEADYPGFPRRRAPTPNPKGGGDLLFGQISPETA